MSTNILYVITSNYIYCTNAYTVIECYLLYCVQQLKLETENFTGIS